MPDLGPNAALAATLATALAAAAAMPAAARPPGEPARARTAGFEHVDDWVIARRTSEFDGGGRTHVFSVGAPIDGGQGQVRISMACANDATSVLFSVAEYGARSIETRLDDAPPVRRDTWWGSENSIGPDSGGPSIRFIREMLAADELRVRIHGYTWTHAARFDLTHLREPVEHIALACGWTP